MNKEEKKQLKNFIENIKIPKIFYAQNLLDLIDNHMIILSQIDLILHNEKMNSNYINVISKEDLEIMEKISQENPEIRSYIDNIENVIRILNKLN